MMSMQDLFYGGSEPVWVLKPEKNDNKKGDDKNASGGGGGKKAAEQDDTILARIPFYPYYYPDYVAPTQPKKDDGKADAKKETKVVMKVPICCGECVELIEVALNALKGVKSVECNIMKERVTVVTTTAAPADIVLECRKVFKKSRMWSDDD